MVIKNNCQKRGCDYVYSDSKTLAHVVAVVLIAVSGTVVSRDEELFNLHFNPISLAIGTENGGNLRVTLRGIRREIMYKCSQEVGVVRRGSTLWLKNSHRKEEFPDSTTLYSASII